MATGYNEKGSRPMVKCWCPVCETHYKKRLFWTGRGIPRVICDPCKSVESDTDIEEHRFHIDDQEEYRRLVA